MYTTIIFIILAFAAVLLAWCVIAYQESQQLKRKIRERETYWHWDSEKENRRTRKKLYFITLAGVLLFYAVWVLILSR